jgi:superfamily I DNA/RNA helicase
LEDIRFKTYEEMQKEAIYDSNLESLLNLTTTLAGMGLHKTIENMKSVIVDDVSQAKYTLTTAHKSKGLEWDEVTLADDLLYLEEEGDDVIDVLKKDQCCELIYVALTRAKYKVNLPLLISEVIGNV